MIAQEEAAL
jgi:hypothetical protein